MDSVITNAYFDRNNTICNLEVKLLLFMDTISDLPCHRVRVSPPMVTDSYISYCGNSTIYPPRVYYPIKDKVM